jgi:hypothetical protein
VVATDAVGVVWCGVVWCGVAADVVGISSVNATSFGTDDPLAIMTRIMRGT